MFAGISIDRGKMYTNIVVLSIWLYPHTWTYGPYNYFLTLPALISEHYNLAWVDYVRRTQESLAVYRRRMIAKHEFAILSRLMAWYDDDKCLSQGIKERRWMLAPVQSGKASSRMERISSDFRLAIRLPRCHRTLIALVYLALYTYGTERTIKLNLTKDANVWGYGQTASLVLAIPSAVSLVQLVSRLRRRSE